MSNSTAGGRGTLYYKAPEMFAFPPHVSAAADVYSYAILAWVVATGGEEQPYRDLVSPETAMPAMLAQGVRPELPSGDWRESTTAGLANLIEACWAQAHAERPAFGGAMGVVERIDGLEVYPNPNPDPDPNPNPNPIALALTLTLTRRGF